MLNMSETQFTSLSRISHAMSFETESISLSRGYTNEEVIVSSSDYLKNHISKETNNKYSFAVDEEMSRQNENKEKLRIKRLFKTRIVYVLGIIFIIVAWIAYISAGIAVLIKEVISDEELNATVIFNNVFVGDNAQCSFNRSFAFDRYNLQSLAIIESNYTSSIYNITSCDDNREFFANSTTCTPICLVFSPGSTSQYIAYRVTTTIGACITIIACIFGMTAWLNKSLWKYPKIINFYILITIIFQGLAILAGQIQPEQFYCTDQSLDFARSKSTPYCEVQGAVIHYFLLSFLLWYLFAIVNLAVIVFDPIRGKYLLIDGKYVRIIHLLESILAWGIPLLIVLITIIVGQVNSKGGYSINNAPEFCIPREDFILYGGYYLLGVIFCLANSTLITLIILKLTDRWSKGVEFGSNTHFIRELVAQISVFSFAFYITTFLVILDFVSYEYLKKMYNQYLESYGLCISLFTDSCCNKTYQAYYFPTLSTISGFVSTTWGVVGITAILNREVRTQWKKNFSCKCLKYFKK